MRETKWADISRYVINIEKHTPDYFQKMAYNGKSSAGVFVFAKIEESKNSFKTNLKAFKTN